MFYRTRRHGPNADSQGTLASDDNILERMPTKPQLKPITAMTLVAVLVAVLNIFVFTRDVPLTVGSKTFNVERVIDGKAWVESPVQTLQTFMPDAIFPNVGDGTSGSFDFADRLRMIYGDESVAATPIIDVREIFSAQEMTEFQNQLAIWGYSSERICPHNAQLLCKVSVAWNREKTKLSGIRMISIRFDELEYAIVDDSVVKEG